MAAATLYALLARVFGSSLKNAFAQLTGNKTPDNLDILQIVTTGDNNFGKSPVVILNVDFAGVVHNPAVSPTNGTRLGVYSTFLPTGKTTAQYFASAFTNLSNQDILQVQNIGGNISYWLDSLGVAHGS